MQCVSVKNLVTKIEIHGRSQNLRGVNSNSSSAHESTYTLLFEKNFSIIRQLVLNIRAIKDKLFVKLCRKYVLELRLSDLPT